VSRGWPARLLQAGWSQLRELTGEADYDRYLDRHRACRTGTPVLTPGEYWRARWEQDESEGARCC
jgi:uncharacterized short protein YbdD (DUF466 family)